MRVRLLSPIVWRLRDIIITTVFFLFFLKWWFRKAFWDAFEFMLLSVNVYGVKPISFISDASGMIFKDLMDNHVENTLRGRPCKIMEILLYKWKLTNGYESTWKKKIQVIKIKIIKIRAFTSATDDFVWYLKKKAYENISNWVTTCKINKKWFYAT